MVQDQFRDFSTSWHGKTCMRRSWISRKISRELPRLRNSWKISSQIISWFQRIQMEIIMIKTIQEYCLVFLWSRNRHGRSPFRWRNSHAGNPWGFFTRSRLDHDGILAEDTLDRLFVVYESLLVSYQGIWIFQFKAFFSKQMKLLWWTLFERTAKMDSVVYILMKNSRSVKRNEMTKKLQVRGVDQTPYHSIS